MAALLPTVHEFVGMALNRVCRTGLFNAQFIGR